MTNKLAWLMVVVLATVFGLTACGGDSQSDSQQGAESFVSMMSAEVSPMSTSANTTVTAEMTMDWAEREFSTLFPVEARIEFPEILYDGVTYNARLYRGDWGDRYLGITSDGRIYGLGDFTNYDLHPFETIDHWKDQVLADLNGGDAGRSFQTLLVGSWYCAITSKFGSGDYDIDFFSDFTWRAMDTNPTCVTYGNWEITEVGFILDATSGTGGLCGDFNKNDLSYTVEELTNSSVRYKTYNQVWWTSNCNKR